jgi:predicted nucleic acid-binding protein
VSPVNARNSWPTVIGYLDTSALVPLLIAEPTSAACRRFWDDADTVVFSRLLYVETAAALAQARRMDCLTGSPAILP